MVVHRLKENRSGFFSWKFEYRLNIFVLYCVENGKFGQNF